MVFTHLPNIHDGSLAAELQQFRVSYLLSLTELRCNTVKVPGSTEDENSSVKKHKKFHVSVKDFAIDIESPSFEQSICEFNNVLGPIHFFLFLETEKYRDCLPEYTDNFRHQLTTQTHIHKQIKGEFLC